MRTTQKGRDPQSIRGDGAAKTALVDASKQFGKGEFRGSYPALLPMGQVFTAAGLPGLESRNVSASSGDQQRRVLVGVALAGDPDLLISRADRPVRWDGSNKENEVLS